MNVNGRLAKAYGVFKVNMLNIIMLVMVIFFINSIVGSYVKSMFQDSPEPSIIVATLYSFITAIGSAIITMYTCCIGANYLKGRVAFDFFVQKVKEDKYTIVRIYLLYIIATFAVSFLIILLSILMSGASDGKAIHPIGLFVVIDNFVIVVLHTLLFFVFSGKKELVGALKASFDCIKDNIPALIGILIILYFLTKITFGSVGSLSAIGDSDIIKFFSGCIFRIAYIFIYLFLFQYYILWKEQDNKA